MPLYEYRCQRCDHRLEKIEKASSPTDGVCPECGGVTRRQLGSPALRFKGSGWYVTDYGTGNGSGKPSPEADKPSPAPATKDGGSTSTSSTPSTDTKVA